MKLKYLYEAIYIKKGGTEADHRYTQNIVASSIVYATPRAYALMRADERLGSVTELHAVAICE